MICTNQYAKKAMEQLSNLACHSAPNESIMAIMVRYDFYNRNVVLCGTKTGPVFFAGIVCIHNERELMNRKLLKAP